MLNSLEDVKKSLQDGFSISSISINSKKSSHDTLDEFSLLTFILELDNMRLGTIQAKEASSVMRVTGVGGQTLWDITIIKSR